MKVMPDFRYFRPGSVAEAVSLGTAHPEGRILAGGTDLVVNLRRGLASPSALIDLCAIPELSGIAEAGNDLRIGAGVTLAQLENHPLIQRRYPALVSAAASVAGATHRVAATVGGNLCQDTRCVVYNESDWWREGNDYCLKCEGEVCHVVEQKDHCHATYHGDLAPVLMVLNAEIELIGPAGMRRLPLPALFREEGNHHLTLLPGELISTIVLPDAAGAVAGYAKVRIRKAIDFSLAAVAIALVRSGKRVASLRVAISGTNSAPLLVPTDEIVGQDWSEALLEGLAKAIRKTSSTVKTTNVSPSYRRRVLLTSARRLLGQLWQRSA